MKVEGLKLNDWILYMEYHFKYAFTEEEYADYNVYTVWSAPWQRQTRLRFIIRQLLVAGVTVLIVNTISPLKSFSVEGNFIVAILIMALITGLSTFQAPYSIRSRARKFIRKEENNHFLAENELTLNDQEVVNIDPGSTTRFAWDSIVRYAVTKEYFYLYINSQQGLIIPKRLFRNHSEAEEFDQFISRKVPLIASFRSL